MTSSRPQTNVRVHSTVIFILDVIFIFFLFPQLQVYVTGSLMLTSQLELKDLIESSIYRSTVLIFSLRCDDTKVVVLLLSPCQVKK